MNNTEAIIAAFNKKFSPNSREITDDTLKAEKDQFIYTWNEALKFAAETVRKANLFVNCTIDGVPFGAPTEREACAQAIENHLTVL